MEIYTTIEEAKEEVWKRWNDAALRKEVEAFVGEIPEPLRKEPRAWLGRYVVTPDIEFLHFLDLAKKVRLKPLAIESLDDKFYTGNADKLGAARMAFFKGRNKNKQAMYVNKCVIDFNKYNGKKFKEIETIWGEGFVAFHHRLLAIYAPEVEVFDASLWFKSKGASAKEYYPYLLALFICHAVLFENFVTDESEAAFCDKVVLPAFQKVERDFGMKPLIVPLAPNNEASDVYWWCYPECMEEEVEKCLKLPKKSGKR